MERLLFLDTETGGLDPTKYSLLTIGFVVWEKERGALYSREICQKLEKYKVCDEALAINNFNISNFQTSDILTPKEIIDEFDVIGEKYFDGEKIRVAGHNIAFDIEFLRRLFKTEDKDLEKVISYKTVDTYSILQYLIHKGKLSFGITSSTKAFDYFGIAVKGRHTALGDAMATMELYNKLLTEI